MFKKAAFIMISYLIGFIVLALSIHVFAGDLGDAPSNAQLAVQYGGTGAVTLTDGGIMLGSGTNAVTILGQATNGQIPIGSTGNDPVLATITGTANEITVTNGAGTITLDLPLNAGTDITADLEEEVTEGSLADSTILSADIKDNELLEADLKAVDAAVDEDILTYETTGGDFEWHSVAEVKTAMSLSSVEDGAEINEIEGDGTNGRVMRQGYLYIRDGTNANTLKCQLISNWNGDEDGPTDNVSKGATTGNYTLNAGGDALRIEAAGLSGNCVMAIGSIFAQGTATTGLTAYIHPDTNDIAITIYDENLAAQDITALVDLGNLCMQILYLTSA